MEEGQVGKVWDWLLERADLTTGEVAFSFEDILQDTGIAKSTINYSIRKLIEKNKIRRGVSGRTGKKSTVFITSLEKGNTLTSWEVTAGVKPITESYTPPKKLAFDVAPTAHIPTGNKTKQTSALKNAKEVLYSSEGLMVELIRHTLCLRNVLEELIKEVESDKRG